MRIEIRRLLFNTRVVGVLVLLMSLIPVIPNAVQAQNIEDNRRSAVHAMTFTQLQDKFYKTEIEKEISVDVHEMTVEQALRVIARETGLRLSYRGDIMVDKMISLQKKNITVSDALALILESTRLDYKFSQDGYLLITEKRESVDEILQQTITGNVVDSETGEALPGVNVTANAESMDSPTGTTTNMDGEYEIEVPDEVETLVFSYIGYESLEVPINGRTEINVEMSQDIQMFDDVVVVGYGTQRRQDITGSVSSVNAEEINSNNVSPVSVDQMLQGRVSGVQVTSTSSEPGGGARIRIRGATSLTADNGPLYVIDGIPINNNPTTPSTGSGGISNSSPRNPLNAINPNDIENIQVLKDASATAIYGSRGANGVIIVSTKDGHDGDLQVNYSSHYSTSRVAKNMDVLNAQEYMSVLNELRIASGEEVEFSNEEIQNIGSGTNWQNEVFRNDAFKQNQQLSFSGGNSQTRYHISLNYLDEEGVVENSGLKRYQGRVNIARDENEKFSYRLNLNTSLIEDNFSPFGIATNEFAGVISSAINQDPTVSVWDDEGNYTKPITTNLENPLGLVNGINDNATTNRLLGNVNIQYEFLENLTAQVKFGSDRTSSRRDTYNSTVTKRGSAAGGIANVQEANSSSYLAETTVNFSKSFFGNHQIEFVGGITYEKFINELIGGNSEGFATDAFLTNSLQAGNPSANNSFTSKNQHQLLSYLGRLSYSYDEKYLLTTTFRIDGSSRFGEGNKYGYFPSIAVGWNLAEEDFFPTAELFNQFKIRSSYGVSGNQGIGNYNSLSLFSLAGQAVFGGQAYIGIAPSQIPNRNLKWERTKQFNIGLDAEMMDGRFRWTIDYFVQNTDDLLLNLPIPTTTGFGNSLQNIGSVENSGIEFELQSYNIMRTNFNWSTSFNISHVRNEVTSIGNLPNIIQGNIGFTNNFSIIKVGEAMNSYYGYKVEGIFQEGEDISNSSQPFAQPGQLKFEDINGDGQITSEDRTILGSNFPDFTFGVDNTISYKNFDFNISIYGSYGNDLMNFNIIEAENPISFRRNRLAEPLLNRWTPENPTNAHPSFVEPEVSYGSNVTSRAVQDASFIRLRNIMLKYNIPTSIIRTASVYISASNLLTITKYNGFNPDVSSLGSSNIVIDNNAYPLSQTFTLGFNINF